MRFVSLNRVRFSDWKVEFSTKMWKFVKNCFQIHKAQLEQSSCTYLGRLGDIVKKELSGLSCKKRGFSNLNQ